MKVSITVYNRTTHKWDLIDDADLPILPSIDHQIEIWDQAEGEPTQLMVARVEWVLTRSSSHALVEGVVLRCHRR